MMGLGMVISMNPALVYKKCILKTRTEGFGEEVKRRIMLGTFVLSADTMTNIL